MNVLETTSTDFTPEDRYIVTADDGTGEIIAVGVPASSPLRAIEKALYAFEEHFTETHRASFLAYLDPHPEREWTERDDLDLPEDPDPRPPVTMRLKPGEEA